VIPCLQCRRIPFLLKIKILLGLFNQSTLASCFLSQTRLPITKPIYLHSIKMVAFEDVEFKTVDGTILRGRLFPAKDRGVGVVMSPGVSPRYQSIPTHNLLCSLEQDASLHIDFFS
jgi:hypothetical protein